MASAKIQRNDVLKIISEITLNEAVPHFRSGFFIEIAKLYFNDLQSIKGSDLLNFNFPVTNGLLPASYCKLTQKAVSS